jgi:hypothetical protein
MDVNALSLAKIKDHLSRNAQEAAIDNLKRCQLYSLDYFDSKNQGLHFITDFQEIKTTWHPIEQIAGGAAGY